MNLYFINRYGGEGLIAENVDMDTYYPILLADLMKRNPKYNVPYTRSWYIIN